MSSLNDNFYINTYSPGLHSLILNSKFNDVTSYNMPFSISFDEPNIAGDVNYDVDLNVVDVVIIVNFSLDIEQPDTLEFEAADINNDNSINVIDVVNIINIILSDIVIEKIPEENGYSYECYPKQEGLFPVILYNHGGLGESIGGDLFNTCRSLY